MKKILFVLALVSLSFPAHSAEFALEKLKAGDIAVTVPAAPVPAPGRADSRTPQETLAKFQQVYKALDAIHGGLAWVRNDLDRLEDRARQIIQLNYYDAFFESDLRKMSSDMSGRFSEMQRAAADTRALLGLAEKSAELNKAARDIDRAAKSILNEVWPALQDSAGRLESTVRSGNPATIGYDSQWTAMDISRYSRQLSDQARYAYSDAQTLVTKTQP